MKLGVAVRTVPAAKQTSFPRRSRALVSVSPPYCTTWKKERSGCRCACRSQCGSAMIGPTQKGRGGRLMVDGNLKHETPTSAYSTHSTLHCTHHLPPSLVFLIHRHGILLHKHQGGRGCGLVHRHPQPRLYSSFASPHSPEPAASG
jgi:hypothetical protein